MTREVRIVVYDTDLQLEAYQFQGIMLRREKPSWQLPAHRDEHRSG
ncbi:hypothetical protein [Paenibacillus sp. Leaf72]|nr:hypothetical protein [Paenibacillus sp. Leaf72]